MRRVTKKSWPSGSRPIETLENARGRVRASPSALFHLAFTTLLHPPVASTVSLVIFAFFFFFYQSSFSASFSADDDWGMECANALPTRRRYPLLRPRLHVFSLSRNYLGFQGRLLINPGSIIRGKTSSWKTPGSRTSSCERGLPRIAKPGQCEMRAYMPSRAFFLVRVSCVPALPYVREN